jgi:hypothetical protein
MDLESKNPRLPKESDVSGSRTVLALGADTVKVAIYIREHSTRK